MYGICLQGLPRIKALFVTFLLVKEHVCHHCSSFIFVSPHFWGLKQIYSQLLLLSKMTFNCSCQMLIAYYSSLQFRAGVDKGFTKEAVFVERLWPNTLPCFRWGGWWMGEWLVLWVSNAPVQSHPQPAGTLSHESWVCSYRQVVC